eukprot:151052-Chlamydomonas_euryale.AAC.1
MSEDERRERHRQNYMHVQVGLRGVRCASPWGRAEVGVEVFGRKGGVSYEVCVCVWGGVNEGGGNSSALSDVTLCGCVG